MKAVLLLVAAVAVLVGCAQPRQPTGGPPIERPPQVVAVRPAPHSVVTELDRPVVISFDERLSERLEGVREWDEAVIVSPETGQVRVRRGRREVQVSVAGGWQPGLVYRVEVLPVLRDLFNNVLDEPIELVFSTGPAIPETAVAGFVEDRLTRRPVEGARVEALHQDSRHAYVALTDSAGFFALRHIPAGSYELRAWLDEDRDRQVDFTEPQDSTRFALLAEDTVVVEMQLLPRDTTPARLVRAAVIDSTKLELGFDDYFAATGGPLPGTARIYLLDDSTFVTGGTLFHGTRLDSLRAVDAAAAEEAARAAADTLDAEPDESLDALARRQPGVGARGRETRTPLPARELVLLLDSVLDYETGYFVVVEDVVNIHGLAGGGGTADFRTPVEPEQPEQPDPDPPDPDAAPPAGQPQPTSAPPPDGLSRPTRSPP